MRGKTRAFEVVRMPRKGAKSKGGLWSDMPGFDAAVDAQRRADDDASGAANDAESPATPSAPRGEARRKGRVLTDNSVAPAASAEPEPKKRRGRPRKPVVEAAMAPEAAAPLATNLSPEARTSSDAVDASSDEVAGDIAVELSEFVVAVSPEAPAKRVGLRAVRRNMRFPPGQRWMRHLPRWSRKARGR